MRRIGIILALVVALAAPSVVSAHWPVHSRSSYISQWFRRGHRAIDIVAPRDANIYAIRFGRVIFSGWRRNCGGWQVLIKHRSGKYSLYAHMLRRPPVAAGQYVDSSTKIGDVGMSGVPPKGVSMVCASGYHVHIELWVGYPWRSGSYRKSAWQAIDHGPWLPDRYR